ncbi:MAG: hypothetical protein COW18_13175 [Zetaproteobacteria bacterium CG12_big_fil_rev_8_21_14_0_65_54_13]|nr:MAG: hypothetical protein COX55_06280 [Zetaproteobacteria bacterium CG23_combo_of_CG06-09_8_20_14_all_54_7]PIW44359.1 MAG: hypothetical protein COW18_13175 [Zetaproteobacteria bacterium CG12_big_fil_rev_8_21_14_0_65_54_13]PIX55086.1 MAG: hypothetical protein COZ50_04545 [Zetaproteobacteria bacterium CG_4_10_14_3_um_filter_54_28]PJA30196.1 MAG: hypothetical protein CO188_04410 [Zetaproteobacteria bacterium CG_4_9_14_3_um_filter_54_145]
MSRDELVSIGLPVYNGEGHLRQALDSLLAQSYPNIEIIVADNASDDSTQSIIDEYISKDGRIRYYRHDKNMGATANFDFVLKKANGEYFMWAAFDDVWDPHWVASMLKGFERKGVVLSFGRVAAVDLDGRVIRDCTAFHLPENRLLRLVKYFWLEEYSGKACLIYGLFKTRFLLQRKPFSKFRAQNFSDMLFVFSCLNHGLVYIDPSVLFYKRMPPEKSGKASVISRIWNSVFKMDRINYYIGHVSEANATLDRAVLLLLLPLKYVKAVLSNIIRTMTR